MSESLELPHVLEHTPAAIICSCEMQESVKERFSPPHFDKGKKRARNCSGRRKHQLNGYFRAHPSCLICLSSSNLCQLQQRTWLHFLDFSKGAIGADELITSKSWTCSLQLLVRVWQKSCRNPCLGGEAAAGSWDLQIPEHVLFQQWESLKERLSSAAKFQGRKLYPSTIKELKS